MQLTVPANSIIRCLSDFLACTLCRFAMPEKREQYEFSYFFPLSDGRFGIHIYTSSKSLYEFLLMSTKFQTEH